MFKVVLKKYLFFILIVYTNNLIANFFDNKENNMYQVIEVIYVNDSNSWYFVNNKQLFDEGWHTLAQIQFWTNIMRMPSDSIIINIAESREILAKESYSLWKKYSEEEKITYKDSLKKDRCLNYDSKIYITTGKKEFYDFKAVMPSITRGIEIFSQQNVDPWYAQAILLIESPGKSQYSSVGAYGPFQLMKSVAKKYNLEVKKGNDERNNFDKSAIAASSLIKTACIPEAKRILKRFCIEYSEHDLWFKLFVLHIYHAGAGNINSLMSYINPSEGGMSLIQTMWKTEHGKFKNSSQNYSQLALSSQVLLDEIIYFNCEHVYDCGAQ